MASSYASIMLKLADNDARRDTQFACESHYLSRICPESQHVVAPLRWNKNALGEVAGLLFLRRRGRPDSLEEEALSAVKQEVSCFMEKTKPKLIVGEVPKAKLQKRLPV